MPESIKTPVTLKIQPNGGRLLQTGISGNQGGFGRPPSVVRLRCLHSFADRIPVIEQIVDDPDARSRDRLAAMDILGRYAGLGTLGYDPAVMRDIEEDGQIFRR